MACQTGKWRYGLLPLAALWIAANWLETGRIEADLASHARSMLDLVAGGAGDLQVSGRDLTLEGVIADRGARASALAGLARVAGVRKVADRLSAPAPTGTAGAAVATLASDAAPVPPPFVAPQSAPSPQVPAADNRGDAAQPASASANPAVVAPYVLHAEKAQGKLTLTGYYPDANSHAAILATVAKDFPGLDVTDQTQPGGGAPKAFDEAAVAGLEKLAQLREGVLDLRDRSARLSGEAAGAGVADEIRAGLLGSLPGGFAVDARLTAPARETPAREMPAPTPVKPAPVEPAPLAAASPIAAPAAPQPAAQPVPPTEAAACQAELTALVKDRPIQFASGSSRILPDSVPTLQALAAAAAKCPNVNFEIAGHTDDVGPVNRNDRMSRRRAENVLVYLVANGIAPERLTAAGYGERHPLVPNDDDESRAKNRRIEFNLK